MCCVGVLLLKTNQPLFFAPNWSSMFSQKAYFFSSSHILLNKHVPFPLCYFHLVRTTLKIFKHSHNKQCEKPINTFPQPNNLSKFCHTCFICLFSFFFVKHFKTHPRHHVISVYRLQYVSLKPMAIFLHNHSAAIIP